MHKKDLNIIRVYMDNFLLGSKNYTAFKWLKDQLIKKFQIKNLGQAKTIIE